MKTMKIHNLKYVLLLALLVGCDKEPSMPGKSDSADTDKSIAKTQFEQADKKIGSYLDKLDYPQTSQKERIQILCTDYPTLYKTKYMPALLKLQPKDFTQKKLLVDLDSALNYYKSKAQIKC